MTTTLDLQVAPRGCVQPELGSRLAAYEWDLLPPPEDASFEEHLVACPACAAELASTSRLGAGMRVRPRSARRVWLPVGAAAAAAVVVLFSQLLNAPRREAVASVPSDDSAASPAQQATMTFELRIPQQTSFTYDLSIPGSS